MQVGAADAAPPAELIMRRAGPRSAFAVPAAVVAGAPLYANVAGVLPFTKALVGKGPPPGAILSFNMAVIALSLPEMVILRKVPRPRLLAVFIVIMTAGIIAVGYLLNALMTWRFVISSTMES
jgi:uncharacterized membrane protein YraQ (UPF0718 family)